MEGDLGSSRFLQAPEKLTPNARQEVEKDVLKPKLVGVNLSSR